MKLPSELTSEAFTAGLRRGMVIRFLTDQLDDPTVDERVKFAVLLNTDDFKSDVLFAFTTSKGDFFGKGSRSAFEFLSIPAGAYKFFSKETIVNLRQMLSVARSRLLARYEAGELVFLGELSAVHLAEIEKKIRASTLINWQLKVRVLPPH